MWLSFCVKALFSALSLIPLQKQTHHKNVCLFRGPPPNLLKKGGGLHCVHLWFLSMQFFDSSISYNFASLFGAIFCFLALFFAFRRCFLFFGALFAFRLNFLLFGAIFCVAAVFFTFRRYFLLFGLLFGFQRSFLLFGDVCFFVFCSTFELAFSINCICLPASPFYFLFKKV